MGDENFEKSNGYTIGPFIIAIIINNLFVIIFNARNLKLCW